jgi:hypothetical protein
MPKKVKSVKRLGGGVLPKGMNMPKSSDYNTLLPSALNPLIIRDERIQRRFL